jgi:hypothetical protein
MIPKSAQNRLQRFVQDAKSLLVKNIQEILSNRYEIWPDGRASRISDLPTSDSDTIHTARMLRERLGNLEDALPDETSDKSAVAVKQLIAEQAFTVLNRFCALKMCEERGIFMHIIDEGMKSKNFQAYDSVTGGGVIGSQYHRYQLFLESVFDELSIEMPSIFNRYSPYGLIFPDEQALTDLLELINAEDLINYYDEASGLTLNYWKEDETLGWLFQYYNSIDERKKMRAESNQPRNSREMAVRNQFFTPEYVVRYLTDNTLGRIWYEMTGGSPAIINYCEYLVYRKGEEIPHRDIKEPTEITMLDPTCGSMHFGMYAFGVFEVIYMDAWDNHPKLLMKYRARKNEDGTVSTVNREEFHAMVPKLILENNIYGAEIDPRALQIAALSLWLRAQRSYSEQGLSLTSNRPLITKSNLVLCEPMPGNKKMLKDLMKGFSHPMQVLVNFIWDKMKLVGEAGLLIKMEDEIDGELDNIRKNWYRINKQESLAIEDNAEQIEEKRQIAQLNSKEAKENFFKNVVDKLHKALIELTQQLSENEGYENVLFAEDALRGLSFIELCNKRFDVIVMNPPFGEGSKNTVSYFNTIYSKWTKNIICVFFDRMHEMLLQKGKLGAIFDRTVLIKSSYESFRRKNLCGYISNCADTGWGVLDANVETSTIILNNYISRQEGIFINLLDISSEDKGHELKSIIEKKDFNNKNIYIVNSQEFLQLPNSIIGYYIDKYVLSFFNFRNLQEHGFTALFGSSFIPPEMFYRNFYEIDNKENKFVQLYHGGAFSMFYKTYRELVAWGDGTIALASKSNIRNVSAYFKQGIGYGKRGEILDAHFVRKGACFTHEGHLIPLDSRDDMFSVLSFINSLYSQYIINQYCEQHKSNGYVNLLPMPSYENSTLLLKDLVNKIIDLKRNFYSLDETSLEYHGFVSKLVKELTLKENFQHFQNKLTNLYSDYQSLVKQNDNLWMDLAGIIPDSEFRQTLNDYKSKRPYEELLSIDGASTNNIINQQVLAQEIVQELVGIAFGRWDIRYTKDKPVPDFGDVFDPLPFMPVVSLKDNEKDGYPLELPQDAIIKGCEIVRYIRKAMDYIWGDQADDIEYELCQLIGTNSLQIYLDNPNGFFAYHFTRYTKSRRKAPIYWPLTSEEGTVTYWVYYPQLDDRTLPNIIHKLNEEIISLKAELQTTGDKNQTNDLSNKILDLQSMSEELERIVDLPYKPNQDDGVPVTAAPLRHLFKNKKWVTECEENWKKLEEGEYDWSHLAYTLYPARIRQKAKKDWCMALTHGLEELCENKPKEKKPRPKKEVQQQHTLFDLDDNDN